MNADPHHYYLFAAYIATWAVHGTYLFILARKAKRVKREIRKLKGTPSP